MSLRLSLIAALADNGVIGRDNKLPWHLPGDLKYFKAVTLGKPVIMGRKTWESLGRPLPGRTNIVITRRRDYAPPGAKVAGSLEEALRLAGQVALIDGVDECVVIGGAEIYAQALPRCDRMYLTEVHADVAGDAFFPSFDRAQWRETKRERHAAEGPNPYDYSLVVYERR
ncbi:MAG: dihydrofolate reductase [Pseudomonadota bacterium]